MKIKIEIIVDNMNDDKSLQPLNQGQQLRALGHNVALLQAHMSSIADSLAVPCTLHPAPCTPHPA